MDAKVKSIEAEGFTVIITMDDGTQYPFRTHTAAGKFLALAPETAALVRDLYRALRGYVPKESGILADAEELLGKLEGLVVR